MIKTSSRTGALAAARAPIRRSAAPLREQVLNSLRESIIAGQLPPGKRLLERELITLLGVSRTVIREALRQLESEGLVAMVPNKGPVVHDLTLAEAKDLYSIRAVLEGMAARWFVEHADAKDISRLEHLLDATAAAYTHGDPDRVVECKNAFYDHLIDCAGSEVLSSMIATLHGRIWRWRSVGLRDPRRSPNRSTESIRNLRAVLAAIKKRDAKLAEDLMRDEVTHAAMEVTRLLAGPSSDPIDAESAGTGSLLPQKAR